MHSGLVAPNDVPRISLPMVGLLRTLSTPLPAKLASNLQVIQSTALFLALGILNDSVLSWLRLDVVVSAPWRWPVFWLLSLIALTLLTRAIAEKLHISAQQKERQRQRSALERVQF